MRRELRHGYGNLPGQDVQRLLKPLTRFHHAVFIRFRKLYQLAGRAVDQQPEPLHQGDAERAHHARGLVPPVHQVPDLLGVHAHPFPLEADQAVPVVEQFFQFLRCQVPASQHGGDGEPQQAVDGKAGGMGRFFPAGCIRRDFHL